jgi:hypothetical protein
MSQVAKVVRAVVPDAVLLLAFLSSLVAIASMAGY